MRNPVKEMRESIGLSRKEFSAQYDVPASTISNCESGNLSRVPENVVIGLRRAGVSRENLEDVQERFSKWRKEMTRETIARRSI